MDIWSQGYVTDVPYMGGFFRELAPSWLNFVAASVGCRPRRLDRPFTYMELGCGHGQTTATLAGAYPHAQFYGVDFHPAHIDSATQQAERRGIDNVRFLELSFADLLKVDLPDFDFITLHGVYVWIAKDMQRAIRDFIQARLKPGGLVYVSYNCMPGWSLEAPMQKWLMEMSATVQGDSVARARGAFETMKRAHETRSGYFQINPQLGAKIESLSKENASYLAHEYLNQNWQAPYSVDVADEMAEAKLTLLGSATLQDNVDELNMTPAAMKYVRTQPTPRLRELASDFFAFRRFRRDVYVRGGNFQRPASMLRTLREVPVGCLGLAEDLPDKLDFSTGDLPFKDAGARHLRDVLAEGAQRIGAIEEKVTARLGCPSDAERLIQILMAARLVIPFAEPWIAPSPPSVIRKAEWRHENNRKTAALTIDAAQEMFLSIPLAGNGISIDPVTAALVGMLDGTSDSVADLARRVDERLTAHGIVLTPSLATDKKKAGEPRYKVVNTPIANDPKATAERLALAVTQINTSLSKTLPGLARLGLLDLS